jgi:hypothetical protein
MSGRRPRSASALSVAAGVTYLGYTLFASLYLQSCTSSGPVSPGPCDYSVAALIGVAGFGIVLLALGILLYAYGRFGLILGGMAMASAVGAYAVLLSMVVNASFSPAIVALPVFGLFFLPGLVLGLAGGVFATRWRRSALDHTTLPEPQS